MDMLRGTVEPRGAGHITEHITGYVTRHGTGHDAGHAAGRVDDQCCLVCLPS